MSDCKHLVISGGINPEFAELCAKRGIVELSGVVSGPYKPWDDRKDTHKPVEWDNTIISGVRAWNWGWTGNRTFKDK